MAVEMQTAREGEDIQVPVSALPVRYEIRGLFSGHSGSYTIKLMEYRPGKEERMVAFSHFLERRAVVVFPPEDLVAAIETLLQSADSRTQLILEALIDSCL
jgi:hypothetical protein